MLPGTGNRSYDREASKRIVISLLNEAKKKYVSYEVKGRKVNVTIAKGAPKGTYKIKVTVAKKGKYKKTTKTIKIVVE